MANWIMLVVGTGIGILALTADRWGVGGTPGFGWKQTVGTMLALALVVVSGVRIVRREKR